MAISRVDFWSFITELVARNPNLGLSALEDGLFANLLIFDYLGVSLFLGICFGGLQALGGISFLFLMKFHVECTQNHVWGPPLGPEL